MRLYFQCDQCHDPGCRFLIEAKHGSPDDVWPTVCPLGLKLDWTELDLSDWRLINGECPDCGGGGYASHTEVSYCPTCDGTGCEVYDG